MKDNMSTNPQEVLDHFHSIMSKSLRNDIDLKDFLFCCVEYWMSNIYFNCSDKKEADKIILSLMTTASSNAKKRWGNISDRN